MCVSALIFSYSADTVELPFRAKLCAQCSGHAKRLLVLPWNSSYPVRGVSHPWGGVISPRGGHEGEEASVGPGSAAGDSDVCGGFTGCQAVPRAPWVTEGSQEPSR